MVGACCVFKRCLNAFTYYKHVRHPSAQSLVWCKLQPLLHAFSLNFSIRKVLLELSWKLELVDWRSKLT